jgi:hypothetical protein
MGPDRELAGPLKMSLGLRRRGAACRAASRPNLGFSVAPYRRKGGRLSSAYHRPLFWSDEYRAMKGRSPWSW